jgi:hypothetical protein
MELYKASVEIKNTNLGQDYASVAMTHNKMVMVHQEQNKLDEAMELYYRALEVRQETVEDDDPSVADTYHSIEI